MSGRDEQGQAFVELALVLPLLVSLMGGIVCFGVAFKYHAEETNLARVAARYMAASSGCPMCGAQSVNAFALATAPTQEMRDNVKLTVSFEQGAGGVPLPFNHCATGNHPVTVTATWPNYVLFPMFNLGKKTMRASVTMRLERNWVGDPSTGLGAPTALGRYDVLPGSASNDVCP